MFKSHFTHFIQMKDEILFLHELEEIDEPSYEEDDDGQETKMKYAMKIYNAPFVAKVEKNVEMIRSPQELKKLVILLEKLSLVNFANIEGVRRLEEAIKFADQLKEVNTEGVEPMVSVLEDQSLYLSEDKVEKYDRKIVQQNASVLYEDFFVAPPGNIPLKPTADYFNEKVAQSKQS